ncbi:MAG: DUF3014 domain-containing protein [bacterium]|nr:DUF3014 domain-containing protein [bacterium]
MEAYKKFIWGSTISVVFLLILMLVYFFIIKPNSSNGKGEPADIKRGVRTGGGEETGVRSGKERAAAGEKEEGTDAAPGLDIRLNNSDKQVRELLKDSSSHGDFDRWLRVNNLIRKCVAVVDNISNGVSPNAHLIFLSPPGKFKVLRREEKIILDPQSYIRYQPAAMVLASLDASKLTAQLRQLMPVMEEAYRELGYPDKRFGEALSDAFEVLLKTPVMTEDILLEEKVTSYAFADDRLEALNDVQKQLIRMGPRNTGKILQKIRELRAALKAEGFFY